MQIRMGQINSGYSWNTSGGAFNPYVRPTPVAIPNTYGGAPAAPPPLEAQEVGFGTAPASCFTCVNPSTGDTQYGVPEAKSKDLRALGYRCHKDECARPMTPGQIRPLQQGAVQVIRGIQDLFRGGLTSDVTGYAPPAAPYTSVMSGPIPLTPGLGRRALS